MSCYEETIQKVNIIKDLISDGMSFEDIQKKFKKMGIVICDVVDFMKKRPEYFGDIGFVRRER